MTDTVFLANLVTSAEPVVGGLHVGGGLTLADGSVAARQDQPPGDRLFMGHTPLFTCWSDPRLDTRLLSDAGVGKRTVCCVGEGEDAIAYMVSGLNGNVLSCVSLCVSPDREPAMQHIQSFPTHDRIRCVDANSSSLVAASDSHVVFFSRDDPEHRRLGLVAVVDLPSDHFKHSHHAQCKIADVCVPPDAFGMRSKREALVLLDCGSVLAVSFVENRIAHLQSVGTTSRQDAVAVRYLSHSRHFLVMLQKHLLCFDLTLPHDQSLRVLSEITNQKRVFKCVAMLREHSYLFAVANSKELMIWDARFDVPLLRRLMPSTDPIELLSYANDCVVAVSGKGLLSLHRLRRTGEAIVWNGSVCFAKSCCWSLNNLGSKITGLCVQERERVLVATKNGHLIEQCFDEQLNLSNELVANVVFLLVGNHNVAPLFVEPNLAMAEALRPDESVMKVPDWADEDELPVVANADALADVAQRLDKNLA